MPNHLHSLVFTKNEKDVINFIIGESKRFMAYEIVSRLKKKGRTDLLKILHDSVTQNEIVKKKNHNFFEPSADIKEILTEKFIRQKLNYIHKNLYLDSGGLLMIIWITNIQAQGFMI